MLVFNDTDPVCIASCRMGRKDDITAVVDSKARVIGVEGLRVIDASSMALLPPVSRAFSNHGSTSVKLKYSGASDEHAVCDGGETVRRHTRRVRLPGRKINTVPGQLRRLLVISTLSWE